jgi:hypothetical protein
MMVAHVHGDELIFAAAPNLVLCCPIAWVELKIGVPVAVRAIAGYREPPQGGRGLL